MSHFRSRSYKVVRAQLATVLARLRLIEVCTFPAFAKKFNYFQKKSAFFCRFCYLSANFRLH